MKLEKREESIDYRVDTREYIFMQKGAKSDFLHVFEIVFLLSTL
jgi:hypothetical protein